jgi:hypothetical protein
LPLDKNRGSIISKEHPIGGALMADSVRCGNENCKADLTAIHRDEEQVPCPECGATARVFDKSIEERIVATDDMSLLQQRGGRVIGFTESKRGIAASFAELTEDGNQNYRITGAAPQGEDDTRTVCQTLARKLNQEGGSWDEPRLGRDDVDCECPSTTKPGEILRIQVVHVLIDQAFWRELGNTGQVDRLRVPLSVLSENIREAIEKKAKRASPLIHLALDASRLPGFAFDDVVEAFLKSYGEWTNKVGFAGIWLVGPQVELTWRLAGTLH